MFRVPQDELAQVLNLPQMQGRSAMSVIQSLILELSKEIDAPTAEGVPAESVLWPRSAPKKRVEVILANPAWERAERAARFRYGLSLNAAIFYKMKELLK